MARPGRHGDPGVPAAAAATLPERHRGHPGGKGLDHLGRDLGPRAAANDLQPARRRPHRPHSLRQLYATVYRAFRRRTLLLLDLQKQIQIEEMPWVACIERFRTAKIDLPLVEELAADIFMGAFSPRFILAPGRRPVCWVARCTRFMTASTTRR